jgi:hypothetical protein
MLRRSAVGVGGDEDADGRQDDLDDQFDPVEAAGVGDAQGAGDSRADERGDDADDDGQPDRDVLLAGNDEPPERTDDETL